MRRLRTILAEPCAPWSLVAYRIAFGLLMAGSSIRFLEKGWVERAFVETTFHFTYFGFDWVRVLSPAAMKGAFVVLAILGAMIALGLFYRAATLAFFLLFTYVELIDVSNYLNHYYLVSLLALLLAIVPAHHAGSLDARLGIAPRRATIPRWALVALRFQVGLVYVYAALAKAGSDWLLHAQPLQIWMSSRTDTPVIGPLLDRFDVALLMSWAGFLNDLLAVPLLLWRRSRPFAFAMILVFHTMTGVFFNIGIFPILMPLNATLFFDPDWPRAFLASRPLKNRLLALSQYSPTELAPTRPISALLAAFLATFGIVQLALPLRTHLYGGNVLWHEQGMRFSWRVMLRKKTGAITYRVRLPDTGREVEVHPRRYLSSFQEREFAGQPDLVLQLAHRIADDFRARGQGEVEVRADALVSLNGRRPSPMIDPSVDLARVADGLAPAPWILPAPEGPPPRIGR